MTDLRLNVIGAVLLAVASTDAYAETQEGIHSGNATVSPGLDLLGTYRSNVYRTAGSGDSPLDQSEARIPGVFLSAHPTLGIGLDTPEIKLDIDAGYTARKYLAESQSNLDRFNDVDLGARFGLLPGGVVGFNGDVNYTIKGREAETEYSDNAYLQVQDLKAYGLLMIRPGSSMEFGVGGFVRWQDFKGPAGASNTGSLNLNDRLEYGPRVDYQWKFFPKTAVVAGYRYSWFYWQDNFIDVTSGADWILADPGVGKYIGIPDGTDSHGYVGLRGRFTERVVLGLTAGYAQMMYDEESVWADAANETDDPAELEAGFDQDLKGVPQGLLGTVDISYELTPKNKVSVGYQHDFRDVYFTNYLDYRTVFGGFDGQVGERVNYSVKGSYRHENYVGEYERSDHFIRIGGNVDVAVARYLDLTLGGGWTERGSADGAHSGIEYDDFSVNGGLKLHY